MVPGLTGAIGPTAQQNAYQEEPAVGTGPASAKPNMGVEVALGPSLKSRIATNTLAQVGKNGSDS